MRNGKLSPSCDAFCRDEVLTKNKFFEEEAKRKAESVEKGSEGFPQRDEPISKLDDGQPDDDIFYDYNAEQEDE